MTTPPDLVLVPRESISISGYRGDKTLLERLQETPLPSLNRICQDRKDAAHFIEAMIASAPSQEGAVTDRDSIIDECAEVARDAFFEAMKEYALIGPAGVGMMMFNSIRSLKKRDGSGKP